MQDVAGVCINLKHPLKGSPLPSYMVCATTEIRIQQSVQ